MRAATKGDWKIKEMPEEISEFNLNKEISIKDFEQVKLGLVPHQMEDKWFIYFEDYHLYFHRSWVGSCIFIVTIENDDSRVLLSKTVVNRNKAQYKFKDDEEDKNLVDYLIDRLLIGKKIPFPSQNTTVPEDQNVHKHNFVGYGRANNEE